MRERLRVAIRGAVQGVGFRPFVYRLARELALDGWVSNSSLGVVAEFEGHRQRLERCLERLGLERPPRAVVQSLEATWLDAVSYVGFTIRDSDDAGGARTLVMPDIATCSECRAEVADPADRRYRYPFTNCTNCGPRFSIIHALPYDRGHTSMRGFTMCAACQREYDDPRDRRFHAQPNACAACGPQLALWDASGRPLAAADEALRRAVEALADRQIVAVKGLGGFQLLVDARCADAVDRLRQRKHREEKPFAVMVPELAVVEGMCVVSASEARLLLAPEAPIVLLERRRDGAANTLASAVAPGSAHLGVMLPYTPLHHLLLADCGAPLICTSGNLADEPMVTDENQAVSRLGGIADLFLVHDRPIVRHVDDSIVRVMLGRELVMRRARGYAPLPIELGVAPPPMLAVGGHLKNTVVVTSGPHVFISQHIGDLELQPAREAFREAVDSLQHLLQVVPETVIADGHPGYASTAYAADSGLPMRQVQHHWAHIASCMAENQLTGDVLGVAWDGTGDGLDGTIWGGEFLHVRDGAFTRAGCLRPFRLPGGERAVREPRRAALGVLHAVLGDAAAASPVLAGAFTAREAMLLMQALDAKLNAPITTSAGRLFDAVAALVGVRHRAGFEGQAAMALEAMVDLADEGRYPFTVETDAAPYILVPSWHVPGCVVDWAPLTLAILDDLAAGVPAGIIAGRFHNTLAAVVIAMARHVGEPRVVLSGGCFQNRVLTERVVCGLRHAGFRPYWHQRVPPNDGGIALGQIAAAAFDRPRPSPPHSALSKEPTHVSCSAR